MRLCRCLPVLGLLLPVLATAHNFDIGHRVPPVLITDDGELRLEHGQIHYSPWKSTELAGKIRVVQYIAGRTSAKNKNALLIQAIKRARFPSDRFQPTTIVNTDDAIPGSGFFVRRKVEKNKRRYPWAQFIIDSDGLARRAWQLKAASSTILVLDQQGRIQWVKDGALTPDEVARLLAQVHHLLDQQQ
ncbi:YtfJ family protein [Erwinia persicina]|uniref:YtfJ family protein n=1 Tax=Erwinia persicina TaxID=55211 RepID=UPI0017864297|nr:YtfJ family protein [Erwinia persicina]MBD8165243.1 YtfJ family protein [Erwinia persicina]MBD8215870.1 YtfJ family protein [Erwinia persicina]